MTTNEIDETSPKKKGLSRRTVVAGTAWAVPAIVVAGPAPHAAATPLPPVTIGATAEKCPGEGQGNPYPKGIRFHLFITNPNKTNVTVTIDSLTTTKGGAAPNIAGGTITATPGTHEYIVIGYPFDDSGNTSVTVKYHYTDPTTGKRVDGTAGPTTVNLNPVQSCTLTP